MVDYDPTERELEALKILWERGESTVREVYDALGDAGEELAYTTVLSLLQVMEQKGLVSHRQRGKAYVYAPLVEREKTFGALAKGFLDRVFDGAIDEYLVHALRGRKLSASELDEIEAMIADARSRKPAKGPKKKGGKR